MIHGRFYKKTMVLLLLTLSCTCFRGYIYAGIADDQKNVLVINSYHQGFVWTKEETEGIVDTLKKDREDLSVSVEYMDWKNYPTQENIKHLKDYFKYKYTGRRIDALVATDDAAFEFALANRAEMFSDAPVIFCGVNEDGASQIARGYKNYTGALERVSPEATVKIALALNPGLKNIRVLFDNSESGLSTGRLVMDKIRSMDAGLNVIPLNNLTYDELLESAASCDRDDIILVTTYFSDAAGRIVDFDRASRDVSASSRAPVYHLYDLGLGNGAFGGDMISGRLQGENAAALTLRVLNGESPDDIPVVAPETTRRVFDYEQLKRFGIPASALPEGCEVINRPFSFFETYKTLALGVLGAFAALAAFALSLLFYIIRIRKIKKELSESHEELTQTYEELSASDEELRQQFDEISAIQERLTDSEEKFRIAAEGSDAVIWDVDMTTMRYWFSDRFYDLMGYKVGEIGESHGGWMDVVHPDDAVAAGKARNAHLEDKTPFYNCEYRMKKKSGDYIWLNVRGKVHKDCNGNNVRFAGSLIDITGRKNFEIRLQESYEELGATYEELTAAQDELKRQFDEILENHDRIKATEERLSYLAFHDTLTGLPNRQSLYESINKEALHHASSKAVLLYIDMDNFKYINDTMGHAFGDRLISGTGERLALLATKDCSLYRLSGDEFIIILNNISSDSEVEAFASHILAGFKEAFNVSNSMLHVSLSIGIAIYPEHGTQVDELLKNADIAMHKAKDMGRNRYVVYDQLMNEAFTERMNIEKYLQTASARNEFEIYYQPQLDLRSNRITGLEALLRWNSPELGPVSPLKFIKVAEDTHLIISLGTWVLRNACAFLDRLHKMGHRDLSVSVNISTLQLLQTDFIELVLDALEFYGLEPCFLELEITETIMMESLETIASKLKGLKDIGVRIALDDFGKGYSSLSYLKQLPISTLKIDKSFIDSISTENRDEILTGHIVTIGKSMGLCVIAEGVEKQEQLEYLLRRECHKIQGFLFSKPVPEAEIWKILNT